MAMKKNQEKRIWRALPKCIQDVAIKWYGTARIKYSGLAEDMDRLFNIEGILHATGIMATPDSVATLLREYKQDGEALGLERQKTACLQARLKEMHEVAEVLHFLGERFQARIKQFAVAEAEHVKNIRTLADQREQVLRGIEPTISVLDSVADRNIPASWTKQIAYMDIDTRPLTEVPELPKEMFPHAVKRMGVPD